MVFSKLLIQAEPFLALSWHIVGLFVNLTVTGTLITPYHVIYLTWDRNYFIVSLYDLEGHRDLTVPQPNITQSYPILCDVLNSP